MSLPEHLREYEASCNLVSSACYLPVKALSVAVQLRETDLQISRREKTLDVRFDSDPDLLATTLLRVGGFARMSGNARLLSSKLGVEIPYTAL